MKIIIRFVTRVTSPSIKDAIKIAKNCKYYIEGSEYYVHFDTSDENLQKLLNIVGSWKTTRVFVDDEEVNAKELQKVLFCPSKSLCKGICDNIRIGWRRLDEFLRKEKNEERLIGYRRILIECNTAFLDDEEIVNDFGPFLEEIEKKKFRLEKDRLKEWINNEFSLELRYCEKINIEKILEIIDNLPDVFEVADISKVRDTLKCPDKFFCNGTCTHLKFGGLTIEEYLKNNVMEEDVGIIEKHELRKIIDFLKPSEDKKRVFLDKEKFKKFIEKKLSFEFEHCKIIDKDKTLNLIDGLPTKLEITEYSSMHRIYGNETETSSMYSEEESIEEFEGLSDDEIRRFAEIFADVFEERLRKILKEIMKNKS